MAKTITAMLIGIALAENKIKSIDDPVSAYVPGLANTEYGKHRCGRCCICHRASRFRKTTMGTTISPGLEPIYSVSQEGPRCERCPIQHAHRSAWNQVALRQRRDGNPRLVLRAAIGGPLRIIFATVSGTRSAPRLTHHGPSTAPGRK